MSFPKIVNQKGSFGQIRKNSLLRFRRPILDIFGFTLLREDNEKDFERFSELLDGIVVNLKDAKEVATENILHNLTLILWSLNS